MIAWLLSPLSEATVHELNPAIFWHGRLMVLAWGVLLPLGSIIARYFKITPRQDWPRVLDNKFWWHTHRALQYAGILAMSLALSLVVYCVGWHFSGIHPCLGWVVLVLGWLQMTSGILRGSKGGPTDSQMRGDHYDMSPWRVGFEYLHKNLGWVAVFLSWGVILSGLILADAPRWILCVILIWWVLLFIVIVYLQRRGCCIDTYQAIWGIDSSMPGLNRKPIGWKVKRVSQNPWKT